MFAGLVVTIVLTALASAVYAVIFASLKWAHEIGRSVHKGKKGYGRRYRARCSSCGVNFLESPEVVDGKCSECELSVCNRCSSTGNLCPLCTRKRDLGENFTGGARVQGEKRQLSFTSLVHSILRHKDHHSSTESLLRKSVEEQIHYSNGISLNKKHYASMFSKDVKPDCSDISYNSSSGWYSDYESDNEREMKRFDTWEDNWSFKKKLKTHEHMQPLAMFVPNPKKESKARIGGVEVDELSDFSDYSDSEIDEIIK